MNNPDLFPWSGEVKYRNAAPSVETGGDWPLWKAFHNGQEQSLAALWVTEARTALVVGGGLVGASGAIVCTKACAVQ